MALGGPKDQAYLYAARSTASMSFGRSRLPDERCDGRQRIGQQLREKVALAHQRSCTLRPGSTVGNFPGWGPTVAPLDQY